MAMGAAQGKAATLQVEMVCLDELVPEDDRLPPPRRARRLVVCARGRRPLLLRRGPPLARSDRARQADLCGALEEIGSHRELLRIAAMRLDLRRFLGYGFGDRLPVHQTIPTPTPGASSTRSCSSGCFCARSASAASTS